MRWDPGQYLRFAGARARPFADLMARVPSHAPDRGPDLVVDLGCGPGNLTRTLAERWPEADVVGVDSSAEMVERAIADGDGPRLRFQVADLREWEPGRPVDVLVSNATLQWVPGHLDLLSRLVAAVRPGGWLAFQVPGNFGEPNHTVLADLLQEPRWRARFDGAQVERPFSEEPSTYLSALVALGCSADVWETTYLQVLEGPDAVVSWMTGTGLRPVLGVLGGAEREEFLAEYRQRVAPAYPEQDFGTVLPYRRVFAVAQRSVRKDRSPLEPLSPSTR